MTNSTLEAIANNSWFKVIDRFAIPVIGALLWQQWQTLDSIKSHMPTLELRVTRVEDLAAQITNRFETAQEQRGTQQQAVMVEIAGLKADVRNLFVASGRIEGLINSISGRIDSPPRETSPNK